MDGNELKKAAKVARAEQDDMQHILTEQSTTAFVSAIIASITFPNLLNPPEYLDNPLEDWQGSIPRFGKQFLYGFFWCLSSSMALISVLSSFAITYGTLRANRRGPQVLASAVLYMKATTFSEVAFRAVEPKLRSMLRVVLDTVLVLGTGFSTWRPAIWQMPMRTLIGSLVWLIVGSSFNLYLFLPSYFIAHVATQIAGGSLVMVGLTAVGKATFLDEAVAQHQAAFLSARRLAVDGSDAEYLPNPLSAQQAAAREKARSASQNVPAQVQESARVPVEETSEGSVVTAAAMSMVVTSA